MNILVLNPGARILDFALYAGKAQAPLRSGRLADYRGAEMCRAALQNIEKSCRRALPAKARPAAWAVRIPFGGEIFTRPVLLNREHIRSLETLVPLSPLHLPAIMELLAILQNEYAAQPVVLAFETAFFAELPQREAGYALDPALMDAGAFRRFGAHGLLHEAACAHVCRLRKIRHLPAPAKILSLCLDPQPEVAAVLRDRPVMVTSGLTPLEGLPGQTTCGELDPGIIMTLSEKLKWGPERIDTVLTRESGLLGLTGERATLEAVLSAERYKGSLGQKVMNYRLLLACGAGIAALGGLNHIVFSGRYAALGKILGPALISRLLMRRRARPAGIQWSCLPRSRERIIADHALTVLMALPVR